MTRLVVSLTDADVGTMLTTAASAPQAAFFECRLDALPRVDAEALRRLADGLPGRAFATYRPVREGGAFDGPESARETALTAALAHGFAAVDVEHDAPFADRLLAKARTADALSVLSRHDFTATPPAADLVKFASEAADRGADVAKFATTLTGPDDALALVQASLEARARGLATAFMAVNDAVLRLAAPALGAALTYAAAPGGPRAAAGQLPVADVARVHADLAAVTPGERLVFLFGDPVAHSVSPAFQNAGFRAAGRAFHYVATRVPDERLGAAIKALKSLGAAGANVTVPHKTAALAHVDALHETARHVGALNTIVNTDGRLVGHNTDGAGALAALAEAGLDVTRERAVVLGAGGAARGVAHALHDAGATVTAVANRSRDNGERLATAVGARFVPWDERAKAVADASLVINATSVGLTTTDPVLPAKSLRVDLAVMDAVYAQAGTPFVQAARRAGCRVVVPGERMLLHQGAAAFTLWTGAPAPLAAMRGALQEAMRA